MPHNALSPAQWPLKDAVEHYGSITMHIDVNSAYLSWEAIHQLEQGITRDLRTVPSIVGGNPKTRRGIVLAKSIPAKRYGIQTGETLHTALEKCPHLEIVAPTYGIYMDCSNAMKSLLETFTPHVQRFSVDEFFIEITDLTLLFPSASAFAHAIKDACHHQLGFTCNVGISTNKLLAKIASDFSKPDKVHTLFPEEIPEKLWPLPVSELYMVGRRTLPKLKDMGIHTIGDLAATESKWLEARLKKFGLMLYEYAHGIDSQVIKVGDLSVPKSIGNSTTIPFDVTCKEEAHQVLLSLVEKVAMRLRQFQLTTSLASVTIKYADFSSVGHQRQLDFHADQTLAIYSVVTTLFNSLWTGDAIRHLGVRVANLTSIHHLQFSLLDPIDAEKQRRLDRAVDSLRSRFGNHALVRGCFIHSGLKAVQGGTTDDDAYPIMTSFLGGKLI